MKRNIITCIVILFGIVGCTSSSSTKIIDAKPTEIVISTETPTVTISATVTPTETIAPTNTITPLPTDTPEPEFSFEKFPPILSKDFYPNGITRGNLLSQLSSAEKKSGELLGDEVWEGIIRLTGDIRIPPERSLTINPGTLIFVDARTDDQASGNSSELDWFNPKDPPFNAKERITIEIQGTLVVNGTAEQPVIFTSTAETPQNDDWGGLDFQRDAKAEITRAVIEYMRLIGINSPNIDIQKSIIRNMMEAIVIGGIGPDTEPDYIEVFTPTLHQNYIYNTGRHAVTVRSGVPTISHNIIIARYDLETTGWEQGAIGMDSPSCGYIHHNLLSSGQPRYYDGEVHGEYHEYTIPQSVNLVGFCDNLLFEYNTIIDSPLAVATHAGQWKIANNNILPWITIDQEDYDISEEQEYISLGVGDFRPEQSDNWQFVFLEKLGGLSVAKVFDASNNYYGETNLHKIEESLNIDFVLWDTTEIVIEPIVETFIEDALPDWSEFQW